MARSTDRTGPSVRSQLAQGSAWLKTGDAQALAARAGTGGVDPAVLAAAIDEVLAPAGWEVLRSTDPSRSGETATNMNFLTSEDLRDEIEQAVKDDQEVDSVTTAVNKGFRMFVAGLFTPKTGVRQGPSAGRTVAVNFRPNSVLRQQVQERGGKPSRVAYHYLMFRYGLGLYAPEVLPKGPQRNPYMPRVVRDAVRAAAKGSGDQVDAIVNEGFQKFLDGSFTPQPVEWPAEVAQDMVPLRMHPAEDLFNRVQAACVEHAVFNAKTGPNQIAVDYLLDQLGIAPDGTVDAAG